MKYLPEKEKKVYKTKYCTAQLAEPTCVLTISTSLAP